MVQHLARHARGGPTLRCALAAALALCGCERTFGSLPSDRAGAPSSAERPIGASPHGSRAGPSPPASAESSSPDDARAVPGSSAAAAALAGNITIESFAKAKRLAVGIYADHRTTIYCGCSFDERLAVEPTSCGYEPLADNPRARRVEWEHVVPAEAFGRSFASWREGHPECVDRKGKAFRGRECARKTSREFRLMEADLYNLYPAIGELNGLRGNFAMAEIEGEAREHGDCDVEIEGSKFEPRSEVKGDVARTYLYMDQAYPGRGIVSGKNRKLFQAWSAEDPVDDWECTRGERIAAAQHSDNPVLAAACAARR